MREPPVITDIIERLSAASMHEKWPDDCPGGLVDEAKAEISRLRGSHAYAEPELRSMAVMLSEMQRYTPAEQGRILWWLEKRLASRAKIGKRVSSLRNATSIEDVAALETDHHEVGSYSLETDGTVTRLAVTRKGNEVLAIELPKPVFDELLTAYFAPQTVFPETPQ